MNKTVLIRLNMGSNLFNLLAEKLKSVKGIDRRSLFRFRQFYILYPGISKVILSNQDTDFHNIIKVGSVLPQLELPRKVGSKAPQSIMDLEVDPWKLVQKLSYTHIEQLLKIDDPLKRAYYEIEGIKGFGQ